MQQRLCHTVHHRHKSVLVPQVQVCAQPGAAAVHNLSQAGVSLPMQTKVGSARDPACAYKIVYF